MLLGVNYAVDKSSSCGSIGSHKYPGRSATISTVPRARIAYRRPAMGIYICPAHGLIENELGRTDNEGIIPAQHLGIRACNNPKSASQFHQYGANTRERNHIGKPDEKDLRMLQNYQRFHQRAQSPSSVSRSRRTKPIPRASF